MVAHGAHFGGLLAHHDVAAVAALPDGIAVAREDDLVLDVLQELAVALLVGTLDGCYAAHGFGDVVESFLVLREIVSRIYLTFRKTEGYVCAHYPHIRPELPDRISFVTTQELEDRYPDKTSKEREYLAAKEYGAVFLMQVGGVLRSGRIHDGRAPDYDDWSLNGDILLYDPLLDISLEVSSMGIRVDPETLKKQLAVRGCEERAKLPFQKALLNGELPQTIGGGIGQSRMCVYFLRKAHVGEVQASLWPEEVVRACRNGNIPLL